MNTPLVARPEDSLRTVLWEEYIEPVAAWLAGDANAPMVLAQASGSSWECAISVLFLQNVSTEIKAKPATTVTQSPIDVNRLDAKISESANWLLDQCQPRSSERPFWEGVTWDTAVCVRVIGNLLLDDSEAVFSADRRDVAVERCGQALRWLTAEFKTWEENVTYPFGPSDLAQIAATLMSLSSMDSPILDEAFKKGKKDALAHAEAIVRYLVEARDEARKEEQEQEGDEASSPVAAFWGDFFQSGEVVEALALFVAYGLANSPGKPLSDPSIECRKRVVSCIQYFEDHQVDGRWGTHSDTCRALYAYLRASRLIPDVGPEDHLILKALRWMCDRKQVFADGSFMHTMFITVFYALALWEAYKYWEPAKESTMKVYDSAFWAAPVRSTPERAKRLALQVERDQVRYELVRKDKLVKKLWAGAAFVGVFVIAVVYGFMDGALEWTYSRGDTIGALGFLLSAASAAAGLVYGWPFKRRNKEDQNQK